MSDTNKGGMKDFSLKWGNILFQVECTPVAHRVNSALSTFGQQQSNIILSSLKCQDKEYQEIVMEFGGYVTYRLL